MGLRMSPTGDCAAFAFRDTTVSIGEVVRAAQFRDELRPSVSEVAWGIACEDEAARWNLETDDSAVEEMVDRFRYENDLISAEEAEAWLDARGLTQDEFRDYFNRRYWRETLREKVIPERVDPSRVVPELLGLLQIELVISGAFVPIAVGLSRRLVARAAAEAPAGAKLVKAERARFLERSGLEPGGLAGWLKSLDRSQDWLEGMLEMEASYRLRCGAVLTPERLSRELAAARLPLTRLEVETVEFDSADAAREALLCVRDDGLSLEEVARESRYPFKRIEVLAEELPEDQRQKLLCAGIGEIQEPAQAGGAFQLSRVLGKAEPALGDALVRGRVEQRILNTYFSEAGAKDIRWFIR
jgi:hypothetical protein